MAILVLFRDRDRYVCVIDSEYSEQLVTVNGDCLCSNVALCTIFDVLFASSFGIL